MTRPISIEYLDEIQDGFNQHDVNAILATFTTDCIWLMARGPHAPEGQKCIGKKEIGDVLRARYHDIPDMRWEEMRHWICDDTRPCQHRLLAELPETVTLLNASAVTCGGLRVVWLVRRILTGSLLARKRSKWSYSIQWLSSARHRCHDATDR